MTLSISNERVEAINNKIKLTVRMGYGFRNIDNLIALVMLRCSSLVLPDHHPEWRKITGRDRTFWSRGYYVSSVGLSEATIRRYVREREDASRIAE